MRALVLERHNAPFTLKEVTRPAANADQVLVRIKASNCEGFDIVYDTVGGTTLDDSFQAVRAYTGHAVSCLGWGLHKLAPLSFRGATYSGVFTLMPMLTGKRRAHHGEILREATKLAEAGKLTALLNPERFTFETALEAHLAVQSGIAVGKVVIEV